MTADTDPDRGAYLAGMSESEYAKRHLHPSSSAKGNTPNYHFTSGDPNPMKLDAQERRYTVVDANVEAVREALARRAEHGLQKYGVTTERTDLTLGDWLQHAQEEAMDFCVYLEAAKGLASQLHAIGPAKPVYDREQLRQKYPDEHFNRWLDEGISDGGHTVFDWFGAAAVPNLWEGWDARQHYDPVLSDALKEFLTCDNLIEPSRDIAYPDVARTDMDVARAKIEEAYADDQAIEYMTSDDPLGGWHDASEILKTQGFDWLTNDYRIKRFKPKTRRATLADVPPTLLTALRQSARFDNASSFNDALQKVFDTLGVSAALKPVEPAGTTYWFRRKDDAIPGAWFAWQQCDYATFQRYYDGKNDADNDVQLKTEPVNIVVHNPPRPPGHAPKG
jgi:hypothetical protein